MKRILFVSTALAMSMSSAQVMAETAASAGSVRVEPLMTAPLPEYPGKETEMIMVEYGPGAADPVHRHDAHAFIYVLEGTIVMGVKGSKPVTLEAGQTFHEGPEDVHVIGRNASKTKPARFVVFLVKKQGAPVLIPVE